MALIKCPECGKDNVSSTAVSCPNCGFNVKQHLLQQYQAKQKRILDKRYNDIKQSIKPPLHPYHSLSVFIIGIILLLSWPLIAVATGSLWSCVLICIPSIIMIYIGADIYRKHKKEYDFAIKNFDAYALAKAKEIVNKQTHARSRQSKPRCPYCHSNNIHKISTVSRLLSTGFFGLGSGKIGKQWHCNNCGSDF